MMFFTSFLLLLLIPLVLCAEDYYKLLGIDKSASDSEIKKAYRRLSKKWHPDKNPDNPDAQEKFVAIAEAYDVLIDGELRKIYNQYGHEGVKQHQQGGGQQRGHDPFDLFSQFFGGGGRAGGGVRRGPNMEVRLSVPLADFYKGVSHMVEIEKQAICSTCEGSGSKDGKTETCSKCGGHGMVIQKHMLAPGIFQQIQQPCDQCGGRGQQIKHKCPVCAGTRVVREKEEHEVVVEKGMPKGVRLTYENEADESPDYVAGDLIIQLVEQEPRISDAESERLDGAFFRRRGQDLLWREVLSLREAWMGDWSRNLTHMDGHVVRLSRPRGSVVQPNQIEAVKGEGMPIWQSDQESGELKYGDLLVEYIVVLPDQMESGMEKEFWNVWDKWRRKKGVQLDKDLGRPEGKVGGGHDEL